MFNVYRTNLRYLSRTSSCDSVQRYTTVLLLLQVLTEFLGSFVPCLTSLNVYDRGIRKYLY